MIQILLHSSKTMRIPSEPTKPLTVPQLLKHAQDLARQYARLSPTQLAPLMKISPSKAKDVQKMYADWSADPASQIPAIDAFIGDIYSGLQVPSWTHDDRKYAHHHLLILSGLYGAVRACDGIMPYRLEMAYKLPDGSSLYRFWADTIASLIPTNTTAILNLSAVEYTKAVLPYVELPIITPKFLTISPKTGDPTFVTVHAKIARGAYARWLIQNRIDDTDDLAGFTELGYRFDASASTSDQPVFVCREFQGIGLSIRLLK